MQATRFTRRTDDLGRVTIPKEIRRNMNIKDGDPLDIFLEDGMICFKKQQQYNDDKFKKAYQMAKAIVPCGIAILNSYEDYVCGNSAPVRPYTPVYVYGDTVCYVAGADAADYPNHSKEFALAAKVLSEFFKEDE